MVTCKAQYEILVAAIMFQFSPPRAKHLKSTSASAKHDSRSGTAIGWSLRFEFTSRGQQLWHLVYCIWVLVEMCHWQFAFIGLCYQSSSVPQQFFADCPLLVLLQQLKKMPCMRVERQKTLQKVSQRWRPRRLWWWCW